MDKIEMSHFFDEIITLCDIRISHLRNSPFINEQSNRNKSGEESFNFSVICSGKEITPQQLETAKDSLREVKDADLLGALRDEFSRQKRNHENEIAKSNPRTAPTIEPSHHTYFHSKTPDVEHYRHFDGEKIARELVLDPDHSPQLLISGRHDTQMCTWNLAEALIAEDLGNQVTEEHFNKVWFENGGYPYVRPTRRIRRFLSMVVKK